MVVAPWLVVDMCDTDNWGEEAPVFKNATLVGRVEC